jgi:hypothetical protein
MNESEYVNALESEEFMTYFKTILNNEFECTFTNVEVIKNVISTSVRYFVMISDVLKVKQNVSKVKFSYVMCRSIPTVTVKKSGVTKNECKTTEKKYSMSFPEM